MNKYQKGLVPILVIGLVVLVLLGVGGTGYYLFSKGQLHPLNQSQNNTDSQIRMSYNIEYRQDDNELVYALLPKIEGYDKEKQDAVNFNMWVFEIPINNYVRSPWNTRLYVNCFPSALNKNLVSVYCFYNGLVGNSLIGYLWAVTLNYNMNNLKEISLSDIFNKDSNYLNKLQEEAKEKLNSIISNDNNHYRNSVPGGLVDGIIGGREQWLESVVNNLGSFTLTPNGLVLYFDGCPPQSLSMVKNLDGIQQITIPWSELKGFANNEVIGDLLGVKI